VPDYATAWSGEDGNGGGCFQVKRFGVIALGVGAVLLGLWLIGGAVWGLGHLPPRPYGPGWHQADCDLVIAIVIGVLGIALTGGGIVWIVETRPSRPRKEPSKPSWTRGRERPNALGATAFPALAGTGRRPADDVKALKPPENGMTRAVLHRITATFSPRPRVRNMQLCMPFPDR
jgi:hypothetical protein